MTWEKHFIEGQKVIVVFGEIMDATVMGRGSFSKFYPDHSGRYKVRYKGGSTGDPAERIIFPSREDYYLEQLSKHEKAVSEYKKRLVALRSRDTAELTSIKP